MGGGGGGGMGRGNWWRGWWVVAGDDSIGSELTEAIEDSSRDGGKRRQRLKALLQFVSLNWNEVICGEGVAGRETD